MRGLKASLALVIVFGHVGLATGDLFERKFDEFGGLGWEAAMARLDNYVIALRNEPDAIAVIVVHARKHGPSREISDWAACVRYYLVNQRKIRANRIVFAKGAPLEFFETELWIDNRKGLPASALKELKLGRHKPRRHLCGI